VTMATLQIMWSFVKKYWQVMLLGLSVLATVVLFKKQQSDFANELKKINDAHQAEVDAINKARQEEIDQHNRDEKVLKDALAAAQKEYDAASKSLDEQKKKEIEQLVKQYSNDPTQLAQKLSDATGFKIILPS